MGEHTITKIARMSIRAAMWVLFLLGVGTISAFPVQAQTVLTASQVTPLENTNALKLLQDELKLNMKTITDDSSITITFIPPSNHTVNLTVDGQLHEDITSPYTIKDLSIGIHQLVFAYTNKDNVPREIQINLIVVPKKPIIQSNKTLFIKPEPIKISGKALPNAYIMVIVNSSQVLFIPTDPNGSWEFIPNYTKLGTYRLLFFTYKSGLISKTGAPLTIEYKLQAQPTVTLPTQDTDNRDLMSTIKAKITTFKTQAIRQYQRMYNLILHNPHGIWAGIALLSGIGTVVLLMIYAIYFIYQKKKNSIDDYTLEELLEKIPDAEPSPISAQSTPKDMSTPISPTTPSNQTQDKTKSKGVQKSKSPQDNKSKKRKTSVSTTPSTAKTAKNTANAHKNRPKTKPEKPLPEKSPTKKGQSRSKQTETSHKRGSSQKAGSPASNKTNTTQNKQVIKVKKGKKIETLF